MEVYARNAALLADGPNRGDVFYYDPHTKEYTGQLKVLKGWCGRRHGITKVMNLDAFHTRSGRCCFIAHYSPYYDLRERFFMGLAQFDQLFDEQNRHGRTFVIDRAIYGLAVLQSFVDDYVITWEKGYKTSAWDANAPTVSFTRNRVRNSREDTKKVTFHCQESKWKRDRRFRRILVRVERQGREAIEVSVVTNNPTMTIDDVVWSIFCRWLQENDFKYLIKHFGIDQLTSRDNTSFAEVADTFSDRPVESPEYRELKTKVASLESRLGRALVALRKHEKSLENHRLERAKLPAQVEKFIERLQKHVEALERGASPSSRKLDEDQAALNQALCQHHKCGRSLIERGKKLTDTVAAIEAELFPLERDLCDAVRNQSRSNLLIKGNYRLLDPRKKSLFDALRVTASNMFRNVADRFRAIYNDYRDDHAAAVTQSQPGDLGTPG